MITKQNSKYKLIAITKLLILQFSLFSTIFFLVGCSDNIAKAPVIKVFVNGTETSNSVIPVSNGERVEYRFEITAYTTIADIKAVKYDVLSETIKTPTEQLVGGLTNSLNEVVEGVLIASEDTELKIVVKDIDGNEVSNGFSISVQ
jgi:hypothetical protein